MIIFRLLINPPLPYNDFRYGKMTYYELKEKYIVIEMKVELYKQSNDELRKTIGRLNYYKDAYEHIMSIENKKG